MTIHLPIVWNELLRLGRRRITYINRTGPLLIALAFLSFAMAISWYTDEIFTPSPETFGSFMMFLVAIIEVLTGFSAPMVACATLTDEKDENTLGLLLMADLRGWDVVLAKFVSVFLLSEMLLLSAMPFIGFAMIFGGVDLHTVGMHAAMMTSFLIMACAAGTYFSAVSPQSGLAVTQTALLLGLWFVGTSYVDYNSAAWGLPIGQPALGVLTPIWGASGIPLAQMLPGVFLNMIIAAACLFEAVRILPRQIHARADAPRTAKVRGSERGRRWARRSSEPLAKLAASSLRSMGFSRRSIPMRILAFLGLLTILMFPVAGLFMLWILVFRETILALKKAREQGALDDLVLVPVSDEALGVAFWRGHTCATRMYFAAIVIWFAFYAWFMQFDRNGVRMLLIFLPITIAAHINVTALSCVAGTARFRYGMTGSLWAYLFVGGAVIGLLMPLYVEYLIGMFPTTRNLVYRTGAGYTVLAIAVYIGVNVLGHLASALLAVRCLGGRLRRCAGLQGT